MNEVLLLYSLSLSLLSPLSGSFACASDGIAIGSEVYKGGVEGYESWLTGHCVSHNGGGRKPAVAPGKGSGWREMTRPRLMDVVDRNLSGVGQSFDWEKEGFEAWRGKAEEKEEGEVAGPRRSDVDV